MAGVPRRATPAMDPWGPWQPRQDLFDYEQIDPQLPPPARAWLRFQDVELGGDLVNWYLFDQVTGVVW
eukprot:9270552-Lingulodinium_polyedra.AAC.1